MEKGIEAEENNLYKATENVAKTVMDELSDMSANIDLKTEDRTDKNGIMRKTQIVKNYFYNPTFTIPCDNINEKSLDTIFNYVNNRLGKQW